MQRRLTLVLVLLMAGTLLIAGVGTILIARRAARNDATRQLLNEATTLTAAFGRLQTPRLLKDVDAVLRPENGRIVVIGPAGALRTSLPQGLTAADLDVTHLLAGASVTGSTGATVFAAVPAQPSARLSAALPAGSSVAILLTRNVGSLGPSWLYVLLLSGVTLVVAAAAGSWLARRITAPLVAAGAVTGRIARGELSARVPIRPDDYPEVALLGASINAMAEGLGGARDRERQLLLSVSHDLRTPLTSIQGYAEAIADGVASDTPAAATVIVNEAKRLERLVADLLDLARLGADRLSLHVGPTDAGEVVGTAAGAFQGRATEAGLRLEVPPPPPGVVVAADPDRLAQVVANLVENGLSFARGAVTVRVVPRPAGAVAASVLVEDDGPGIAAADLQRIFDRFYQADRGASARGGLGLGLAIVAELVRAMGGRVWAESPIGPLGGTRMVVELSRWSDLATTPVPGRPAGPG